MRLFSAFGFAIMAFVCAGFATSGSAQGSGLPTRYAIFSELNRSADLSFVLARLEDAGETPMFPAEAKASGVLAGLPLWHLFPTIIWPWIVIEDGQPVAMALDQDEASQRDLPMTRNLTVIEGAPTVHELTYERRGAALRFRAVYRVAEFLAGERDSHGALDRFAVSEGELRPGGRPGCLDIETRRSTAFYEAGTHEIARVDDLGGAYAKASMCFSVVDRSTLEDGRDVLHLKAEIEGVTGRDGEGTEAPMTRTKYAIALPLGEASGQASYVMAGDVDGFHDESRLEDINRFAAILEDSIARHDFDLAAQQVKSLNAALADLEAEGVTWHWARRPTAEGVARYNELMEATELYRLAHLETQARVNEVRQQLLVLRSNFSGNIVKSMLKSTINWMNVVPTDPISGLAGYSDIAGALLLPQSLQGWKETAETDASILASQASAIRHFEALETALAQRLDAITDARGALFDRIRENDEQRVLDLDAALRRD